MNGRLSVVFTLPTLLPQPMTGMPLGVKSILGIYLCPWRIAAHCLCSANAIKSAASSSSSFCSYESQNAFIEGTGTTSLEVQQELDGGEGLRKSVQTAPDEPWHRYNLALALWENGRHDRRSLNCSRW